MLKRWLGLTPTFSGEHRRRIASKFLEEVSFAVCRYYNWAVMRYRVPPWSKDQEMYYLGSTVGEAPNLLKECSDAVCAYYGWTLPPEKPRFSSRSEEECIKILTEYGVELPTDR